MRERVRNVRITPRWLGDGDRLSYERQLAGGSETVTVDPATGAIEIVAPPPSATPVPSGHLRSPDGRTDLVMRDGNLFLAPTGGEPPRPLTTDGAPNHGYGISPGSSMAAVTNRRADLAPSPAALWSPDGARILTHRLDERDVPELHLLESVPPIGFRPTLHTYRMPFPSDPLATAELLVIDAASGAITPVDGEPAARRVPLAA